MAKPKPKKKPAAPAKKKVVATKPAAPSDGPMLHSLRTVIYQVDDLDRAKTFYSTIVGHTPYFDEPFYVGYHVGDFELGLDPDVSKREPGAGGTCAYWRVDDIRATHGFMIALGAKSIEAPHDVGGSIEVAVLADPFGNLLGLIQGA